MKKTEGKNKYFKTFLRHNVTKYLYLLTSDKLQWQKTAVDPYLKISFKTYDLMIFTQHFTHCPLLNQINQD